ncbi:MAG: hypothetical protein QOD56_1318 [Gammaproteobacteria bacterium]|jgi:hypothetical protein|nr:hypothetical protein [Gammaproteobacteria bacterium]
MVRPARFAFNPQTAASNAFQSAPGGAGEAAGGTGRIVDAGGAAPADEGPGGAAAAGAAALREFDGLAHALRGAGVEVLVAEDTASPVKPDAVFPNNWVSFHHDGTVVLYPMLAPNRRPERRDDLLLKVARDGAYRITKIVDLSHRENEAQYLEGTGSMVLDRFNRIAYACLSPRTDLDVLGEFAQLLDYDLVTFEAVDGAAQPVYHTNVLMAVGARFAVICGEVIPQAAHRAAVFEKLRATGHDVIEISAGQMRHFAGNLLELAPAAGNLIALSRGAWRSLDASQRGRLESHGTVLTVDIPVIERLGGGGVRCMLAEIHLPKREQRL